MTSQERAAWWILGLSAVVLAGCGGGGATQEGPTTPEVDATESCSSGSDEDGDGKVDCDDEDCATAPTCQPTRENCSNETDDDGDGKADCDDDECKQAPTCI